MSSYYAWAWEQQYRRPKKLVLPELEQTQEMEVIPFENLPRTAATIKSELAVQRGEVGVVEHCLPTRE